MSSRAKEAMRKLFEELQAAAKGASAARVETLLARGASGARPQNDPLPSPLAIAAMWGRAANVRALLGAFDPNEPDFRGDTALFHAAELKSAACARLLLSVSDPKAKSQAGETALMRAAAKGSKACVRLLLGASDADAADTNGATALIAAAKAGHVDCVRLLADHAPLARDENGRDALMWAAQATDREASEQMIKILLPRSNPRRKDLAGWSALMRAAWAGDAQGVEALAPASDLTMRDRMGRTALDFAEAQGASDAAEALRRWAGLRAAQKESEALRAELRAAKRKQAAAGEKAQTAPTQKKRPLAL
jgi:ankyrin repeat protein